MSNRIYYLEHKLEEANEKAATILEQGDILQDDISQSLMNIFSKHYYCYGDK